MQVCFVFLIELNISLVVNSNCQLLNIKHEKCTSMTYVRLRSRNIQTFYNLSELKDLDLNIYFMLKVSHSIFSVHIKKLKYI